MPRSQSFSGRIHAPPLTPRGFAGGKLPEMPAGDATFPSAPSRPCRGPSIQLPSTLRLSKGIRVLWGLTRPGRGEPVLGRGDPVLGRGDPVPEMPTGPRENKAALRLVLREFAGACVARAMPTARCPAAAGERSPLAACSRTPLGGSGAASAPGQWGKRGATSGVAARDGSASHKGVVVVDPGNAVWLSKTGSGLGDGVAASDGGASTGSSW